MIAPAPVRAPGRFHRPRRRRCQSAFLVELHHRGNGLTPDDRQLRNCIAVTETLLRFLFGDDPVDHARRAEDVLLPQTTATTDTPAVVVEIDEMIGRVRRRAENLPLDAAPELAIPVNDVLKPTGRASELVYGLGLDLDDRTRELLEPYLDWRWDVDGVPDTPAATASELENLRFALAMLLR